MSRNSPHAHTKITPAIPMLRSGSIHFHPVVAMTRAPTTIAMDETASAIICATALLTLMFFPYPCRRTMLVKLTASPIAATRSISRVRISTGFRRRAILSYAM